MVSLISFLYETDVISVADPGFPVGGGGGRGPVRGDVDLQRGHFSAKIFVKMK